MDKFSTASDPNADPIELIKLASDKDWVIRTYVASNPSAPREALEMLLLDLKIHDKVIKALLERNKKSGQV